jgi:hypothetical protein
MSCETIQPFNKELYSDCKVKFSISNNIMEDIDEKERLPGYISVTQFVKNLKEFSSLSFEEEINETIKYLDSSTEYEETEKNFLEFMVLNETIGFTPVDFKNSILNILFNFKEQINNLNIQPILEAFPVNQKNYYYIKVSSCVKPFDILYNNLIYKMMRDYDRKYFIITKPSIDEEELPSKINCANFVNYIINNFKKKKYFDFLEIIKDKIGDDQSFINCCLHDIYKNTSLEAEISILPSVMFLAMLKENRKLKEQINDLETQIRYSPGGEGYQEAFKDFEATIGTTIGDTIEDSVKATIEK